MADPPPSLGVPFIVVVEDDWLLPQRSPTFTPGMLPPAAPIAPMGFSWGGGEPFVGGIIKRDAIPAGAPATHDTPPSLGVPAIVVVDDDPLPQRQMVPAPASGPPPSVPVFPRWPWLNTIVDSWQEPYPPPPPRVGIIIGTPATHDIPPSLGVPFFVVVDDDPLPQRQAIPVPVSGPAIVTKPEWLIRARRRGRR